MIELNQRVEVAINEHGLISQGERVVVALSGGGDSVALARLMCEMSAMASWSVVGFLHINHQLRSVANEDADFCRELSNELNVPFLIEKVNVEAVSREFGISVEEAGHRLRHEIFNRICRSQVADCVATGHTRDDLAETVLLRLIRGAGPRGLAGIHPRNGFVVRPLLDITRKELREYLEVQGLPHCEDTTNEDTSVARNRIRHLLIPFLKKNFSEGIVGASVRRFRPILMTTLTTVLAMLPIAWGWGEGGELQAPRARVVSGGLLSGSLITLLAIPIVCHIVRPGRRRKVAHVVDRPESL